MAAPQTPFLANGLGELRRGQAAASKRAPVLGCWRAHWARRPRLPFLFSPSLWHTGVREEVGRAAAFGQGQGALLIPPSLPRPRAQRVGRLTPLGPRSGSSPWNRGRGHKVVVTGSFVGCPPAAACRPQDPAVSDSPTPPHRALNLWSLVV